MKKTRFFWLLVLKCFLYVFQKENKTGTSKIGALSKDRSKAKKIDPTPPPESSEIALFSGYYVKFSESIEKNICGYILRKLNSH